MHSKMFDEKIVESEFCFNKCRYHNHDRNWCHKYDVSIDEVECDFVSYDSYDRTLIIGDNNEITAEEENKIWELISKEE